MAAASRRRFVATIPPNAETGSQASAFSKASGTLAPHCDPAGDGVLDDGDRGALSRVELGVSDQFVSRVGVVDVVIGKLLALDLASGRDARPRIGRQIKRGVLVGVGASLGCRKEIRFKTFGR